MRRLKPRHPWRAPIFSRHAPLQVPRLRQMISDLRRGSNANHIEARHPRLGDTPCSPSQNNLRADAGSSAGDAEQPVVRGSESEIRHDISPRPQTFSEEVAK